MDSSAHRVEKRDPVCGAVLRIKLVLDMERLGGAEEGKGLLQAGWSPGREWSRNRAGPPEVRRLSGG